MILKTNKKIIAGAISGLVLLVSCSTSNVAFKGSKPSVNTSNDVVSFENYTIKPSAVPYLRFSAKVYENSVGKYTPSIEEVLSSKNEISKYSMRNALTAADTNNDLIVTATEASRLSTKLARDAFSEPLVYASNNN